MKLKISYFLVCIFWLLHNTTFANTGKVYITNFGMPTMTEKHYQVVMGSQKKLEAYLSSFGFASKHFKLNDNTPIPGTDYNKVDYLVEENSAVFPGKIESILYSENYNHEYQFPKGEKSEEALLANLELRNGWKDLKSANTWAWFHTNTLSPKAQTIIYDRAYTFKDSNGYTQSTKLYMMKKIDCTPQDIDKIYLAPNHLMKIDYALDHGSDRNECGNTSGIYATAFGRPYDYGDDLEIERSEALIKAKQILEKYNSNEMLALRKIGELEANAARYLDEELKNPDATGEEIYKIQKLVESKLAGYAEAIHPTSNIEVKTVINKHTNSHYYININILNYLGYKEEAHNFYRKAHIVIVVDGTPIEPEAYKSTSALIKKEYVLSSIGMVPAAKVIQSLNYEINCKGSVEAEQYLSTLLTALEHTPSPEQISCE